MVNTAFRLPELSVRYLHGLLLNSPPLSSDGLHAEIAFREQAHTIACYSALASADVDPVAAVVGIPDESVHALPPLLPVWWRTFSLGPLCHSHYASDTLKYISVTEWHSLAMRHMSNIHLRDRTQSGARGCSGTCVLHPDRRRAWRRYWCVELPLSKICELTQMSMAQAHVLPSFHTLGNVTLGITN